LSTVFSITTGTFDIRSCGEVIKENEETPTCGVIQRGIEIKNKKLAIIVRDSLMDVNAINTSTDKMAISLYKNLLPIVKKEPGFIPAYKVEGLNNIVKLLKIPSRQAPKYLTVEAGPDGRIEFGLFNDDMQALSAKVKAGRTVRLIGVNMYDALNSLGREAMVSMTPTPNDPILFEKVDTTAAGGMYVHYLLIGAKMVTAD
jgi:hypothetical protein